MRTHTAPFLLAMMLLSSATAQACDVPVAPPAPDGESATLEEMISAQGEVKAFQAANAEYLECVDNSMTAEKRLSMKVIKVRKSGLRLLQQTITPRCRGKSRWLRISIPLFVPIKPPTRTDHCPQPFTPDPQWRRHSEGAQ